MYLLGYDIGSSSIKAALINAVTGETVGVLQYPDEEMKISSPKEGWAEQNPESWWENLCNATKHLVEKTSINSKEIIGIGIAYQMHGLVLIDKNHKVLRPSIIWCDSRAVEVGDNAFKEIGEAKCLGSLLNSPGNFTASKLKWVKENEPAIYDQVYKFLLPGDYINLKLTGEVNTTPSGLSEGIFWDFKNDSLADFLIDHYGIALEMVPDIVPNVSNQGNLSSSTAEELGLVSGIPVGYRAGDQPNNALSLNVLNPGEMAATGGTSGVVYGVVDQPLFDSASRVNGFLHVNHTPNDPRIGILMCINGAGIQYSWMKKNLTRDGTSYDDMEKMVEAIPIGSEGLRIVPFGNGAERIFENRNLGSNILNFHFNRHTPSHFYRAALEGIAFSFLYGIIIMKEMGLNVDVIRAGNDNLFQSPVFSNTISSLLGCRIEILETTGAIGAAKAAGVGVGHYSSLKEAMSKVKVLRTYVSSDENGEYQSAYKEWKNDLDNILALHSK
jgi:xylulokinase